MSVTAPSRRHRRRQLRQATKRRVRGGERLAPIPIQRVARRVDDAAHVGADRLRRALAGDRPFILGFLVLLIVGVTVMSAPLRSYLDQRDRVDALQQQLDGLQAANGALEQRRDDLNDPEHQELIAREQLNYINPGEVPYVVVPPQRDPSEISAPLAAPAPDERPFYRKVWDALTGWFG